LRKGEEGQCGFVGDENVNNNAGWENKEQENDDCLGVKGED
jgi:hypothetical protein